VVTFDAVGNFPATAGCFTAKGIEGEMGGGTMQPAAEVLPNLVRPAHQAEKCLLGKVLRPRPIPNNAQAGGVNKTGISLHDLRESLRIANPRVAPQEREIVLDGGRFRSRRRQTDIGINGNRHLTSIRIDGTGCRNCRMAGL
jgi:hypothetical protein